MILVDQTSIESTADGDSVKKNARKRVQKTSGVVSIAQAAKVSHTNCHVFENGGTVTPARVLEQACSLMVNAESRIGRQVHD
jgi:hypothetical protein